MRERVPTTTAVLEWVDDHRLLPNAYTQGFLLAQSKAQGRSAYLFGDYRTDGWWYYFPAALLVKTPVTLLVLLAAALILALGRRQGFLDNEVFLFAPAVLFLAIAMTARLNIGLRHVLVLYPLAIVASARAIKVFWTGRNLARVLLVLLAGLLLFEHARVAPHYLAFFNQAVGGPRSGYRYLVDSNLDWGQDLRGLARWMEEQGVDRVNLSYFGTADAGYYGIEAVHLPGAPIYQLGEVAEPELPGWVAVSATNVAGVYLDARERSIMAPLVNREPDEVIGHTIHLYRVERPWW